MLRSDINKLQAGEKPLFSVAIATYKDGGTTEYLGLGYKIINFNKITGYDDSGQPTYFKDIVSGTWLLRIED